MFGFSFGELLVLVVVSIVVIGPKDLPKVLRQLGKWAGQLRRLASDLRSQSGIDDVLRGEGLHEDINEIRKLARGELDNVTRAARIDSVIHNHADDPYGVEIEREREHPREGPDNYGALPDDAIVYAEILPASAHASSPLYVLGDRDATIEKPMVAAGEALPPLVTVADGQPERASGADADDPSAPDSPSVASGEHA